MASHLVVTAHIQSERHSAQPMRATLSKSGIRISEQTQPPSIVSIASQNPAAITQTLELGEDVCDAEPHREGGSDALLATESLGRNVVHFLSRLFGKEKANGFESPGSI